MQTMFKEAIKLVDNNAPLKYRGTNLIILKKLLKMTYNPKIDDPHRQIKDRGVIPIMRAAGVSERQFERVLTNLSDVLVFHRHDGRIDYKLNLEPIFKLKPETDEEILTKMRARRTQRANAKRKDNREKTDLAQNVAMALLQSVLYPTETTPVPTPKADPAYVKSVLDKGRSEPLVSKA